MTPLDFSKRFGISLRKVEQIRAAGFLDLDKPDDPIRSAKGYLNRNKRLPLREILHLAEHRDGLHMLAPAAREKATVQLDELGDFEREAAPRSIAADMPELVRTRDPELLGALIAWLKVAIPPRDVFYAYLGARLMVTIPAGAREQYHRALIRALGLAREDASFAGWWRLEEKSEKADKVTIYRRPANFSLASFDL